MNYNREEIRTIIADYAAITAGTLLIAAAVVYYLVPLNLVTGSVSGLALVLSSVGLGLSDGLFQIGSFSLISPSTLLANASNIGTERSGARVLVI